MTPLVVAVRDVALAVAASSPGTPTAVAASAIAAELDEPLRVAIAGRVKAGKSTLLNALVGDELAATDAGECTRVVTWYRHGITYRVTVRTVTGEERPARFTRADGPLHIELEDPASVAAIVVEWPTPPLRETTFIDTPGIGSTQVDATSRTTSLLAPEDGGASKADAVVYLMRHVHGEDVRFLEDLRARDALWTGPVNALGVLSRADEIGAGRLDALESSRRIAARYDADPRLRKLCHGVVPVAGLLAQGAAGLREEDHRTLGVLASMPGGERADLLLTADRFAGGWTAPVPADTRASLLDRLGLFGVRTAIAAFDTGAAPSAARLADALAVASGIGELRCTFARQLSSRADVLKARAALLALDALVRHADGPDVQALAGTLERIEAGAHDLIELDVAEQLWSGQGNLEDEARVDAARLVGAEGVRTHERLGLPVDASPADLRDAATAALQRWRRTSEHPMTGRDGVQVARVVVRSCEGMLAALSAG